jgi:hypothetical protein
MTASGGRPFINAENDSILNALRFYGSFYEQIPAGSDPANGISDPIYHRETPSEDELDTFLVAAPYFAKDVLLREHLQQEHQSTHRHRQCSDDRALRAARDLTYFRG